MGPGYLIPDIGFYYSQLENSLKSILFTIFQTSTNLS